MSPTVPFSNHHPSSVAQGKYEIQLTKHITAHLVDGKTTCLDMFGRRSNREETIASSQQARRTSNKDSLLYVACHGLIDVCPSLLFTLHNSSLRERTVHTCTTTRNIQNTTTKTTKTRRRGTCVNVDSLDKYKQACRVHRPLNTGTKHILIDVDTTTVFKNSSGHMPDVLSHAVNQIDFLIFVVFWVAFSKSVVCSSAKKLMGGMRMLVVGFE